MPVICRGYIVDMFYELIFIFYHLNILISYLLPSMFLLQKVDDGTITVLEFFKLFNIDFVIHNPRQSVLPGRVSILSFIYRTIF